DVSFISVRKVLPAVFDCAAPRFDCLAMVKPQFEVGRERLGSGGVVRDPQLRAEAVLDVAHAAAELGWLTAGVVRSPLRGPSGNVEFFLWLRRTCQQPIDDAAIAKIVTTPAEAP
ncbi:MAG: rRNA (cytidine1920-2-O)/16S rRNA (cytidine1409-2-O)-methyltransferase, partial [Pseudonocardiales bacterium]|nr:rRNA (cytidine1920-2-O)/16S rRNA (cytidine1409-2-O)-methyltransferase [Pseudonocardiales bacterium]